MQLFLNDIAGSEVLLIIFFVLMFFGSKSIPGLARTLGKTFRQIRDASNDLQSEIKKTTGEMTGGMNLQALIRETEQELKEPLDQVSIELENAIKYEPKSLQTNDSVDDSEENKPSDKVEKDPVTTIEPIADIHKESDGHNTQQQGH
jgi:sec-independent protein translocase protein TatA